jgi:hypothetical protein
MAAKWLATCRQHLLMAALAVGIMAGSALGAAAQVIHVTPAAGVFVPASDLQGVRSGAEQVRIEREGTLGLGINVELGWLRGSIAYASGATVSESGAEGRTGDGSVLAAAADLIVRPLPRLFVQPYVLGGIGLKRQDFSFSDDGLSGNPLPSDRSDVALHAGIGADLMLGGFGVMAEVSDYITHENGSFGQHDVFAMVGLRIRLGGAR